MKNNFGRRLMQIFEKYEEWLLAMPPILIAVVKYALFSMGLMYEDNIVQKGLSFSVYGAYFCLAVLMCLYYRKAGKMRIRNIAVTAAAVLALLTVGFAKSGSRGDVLKIVGDYVIFCIPALIIGGNIASTGRELKFFEGIERLNIVVFPAACGYFLMAVTNTNPFMNYNYLGIMNYFMVGWALLPFLCCTILRFVNQDEFYIGSKTLTAKTAKLVRIVLMLVYMFDIFASGTRGAIIAVPFFLLISMAVYVIHKKKVWQLAGMLAVYVGIYLGGAFIYTPPGFYAIGRMDIVTDGLADGKLVTSNHFVQDEEASPSSGPKGSGTAGGSAAGGSAAGGAPAASGPKAPRDDKGLMNAAQKEIVTDRGELYRLALAEFRENWLTGLGPVGYYSKYNNTPHNILLELLCELGVLGIAVIAGIAFLALKMLFRIKDNFTYAIFMCMSTVCFINLMVSGSIWSSSDFYLWLGYVMTYLAAPKCNNSSIAAAK